MDIFELGDKILALLEMVLGFWNNQIKLVFSLLGTTPDMFKLGSPWKVIQGIEPIFVGVGSSLVVLFFVIGFCSESVDIKEEMRFEVILRMLMRIGIAEWLVANNVTIMKAFFKTIANLVNAMSAGTIKESIQNRIVENGKRGKATWLYIDEFHVLLNSEYSAKYLQQLWKKVRKQGGLCTGITQNVVDLLQKYTATTMLANSEFVALLKQANTDSSKMADVIGVSEAQLRFVTNTGSGMGLIKCGSVVVPFDNTISKDTGLYKLYNTNIHERIEMAKKEKQAEAEKH